MNAAIIALVRVTAFAVTLGNATIPPNTEVEVVAATDSQAPPVPTVFEIEVEAGRSCAVGRASHAMGIGYL
jgi:hypothetical protein